MKEKTREQIVLDVLTYTDKNNSLRVSKSSLLCKNDVTLVGSYLYDPMSGVWTYLFLIENEEVLAVLLNNLKKISNTHLYFREYNGVKSAYVEVIDY